MKQLLLTKQAILILFIGTLVACYSRSTPIAMLPDNSLLTQLPCSPPCWQGLTPGKTSYEEASSFVSSNSLINGNIDTRGTGRPIVWWWAGEQHDPQRSNFFGIDSSRVLEQIVIHPNTDISMQEVFSTYGIPTLVQIWVHQRYSILDEPDGIWVKAYYVPRNLMISWFIETEIKNPMQFCSSLDAIVTEITYDTPKIIQSDQVDLLTIVQPGNFVFMGDSIVHMTSNTPRIDCVNIKW